MSTKAKKTRVPVQKARPGRRVPKKDALRPADLSMKWCIPIMFKFKGKKERDPDAVVGLFLAAKTGAKAWKILDAVELKAMRKYLARHGIRDWTG